MVVESFLRPGYSQTHNFGSNLGVGPNRHNPNINFIIFAVLVIVFSLGLRNGFPISRGKALKAGMWFVVIFSLGVLGAGVFPEDYLSQAPHNLVSATSFVSIILAQLFVWWGLKDADNSV